MGLCISTEEVNEQTRMIDRELKVDKYKRKTEIKILLLGKFFNIKKYLLILLKLYYIYIYI